VAAALAALDHDGAQTGVVRIRVPGGEVKVEVCDTTSFLRGPSVLLARGEVADAWWDAQR
jgi:diaminopimelate epimerase